MTMPDGAAGGLPPRQGAPQGSSTVAWLLSLATGSGEAEVLAEQREAQGA